MRSAVSLDVDQLHSLPARGTARLFIPSSLTLFQYPWLTHSRISVTAPQTTSQPTTQIPLQRMTSNHHTTTLSISMQSLTRGYPAIKSSRYKPAPRMTLNPVAHHILWSLNSRIPVASPKTKQKIFQSPPRAIHQKLNAKCWLITRGGGSR